MLTLRGGFRQNEEAISPVLGAVLIMAIVVTIITNVQLNFVPIWNAQEELDHLKKMNDDFKELKSGIESSVLGGTSVSLPLSMGFKYSPKTIVYNPKESAYASLSIQNNTWAEVRYNEVLPDGVDDATSIKNISTSTLTYSLQGAQNYNAFVYEHGLIRRNGSNYTASSQTLFANNTIYLLSIRPLETETATGVEKKTVNIYPTSPQKNSVIGNNVWLILHTRPEYADWWNASIGKEGGNVKFENQANGIVITYIDSMVIKMGEVYIATTPKTSPARSPLYRLVRVTPQNVNLPIDGINSIAVEVQDYYNNPVPNVQVNFSVNITAGPANAFATANLLQTSAVSGADGRASILLKTGGSGMYYIDASISELGYKTTFVYPASSQSGFISLTYAEALPDYAVTATLKDGFGQPMVGNTTTFSAGEGTLTPLQQSTDANGNASTTLSTGSANGLELTNIQVSGVTKNSAIITWDTKDTITVTANRTPGGYIFNYIDIPAKINTTGCVLYGKTPGNYPYSYCDPMSPNYSHNVSLTNLLPYTPYYFIVNSSRPGNASINSTEYMFITPAGEPDTTAPASISGLYSTAYPLYIVWNWTDPTDPDYDHAEVYINGQYKGNFTGSYTASYLSPGTVVNISTRTVDTSGNKNATWVNDSATAPSVYTYVFDFFDITNGTVNNPDYAKNAGEGLNATLDEELVGGVNMSNRTKPPVKALMNGTQSGSYVPGDLDTSGDGFVDVTNQAHATTNNHATANPTMTLGTIAGNSYLNTRTSDNTYINLRETTAGTLDTQWNTWEPFNNASNSSLLSMNISIEAYMVTGVSEAVYIQLWDYPNNNWNATWHQLGAVGIPLSDTNTVLWYNTTNPAEVQKYVNSTGNYRIRLADAKVATGASDASRSNFYIDEFKVNFTYFQGTVNATYTFTESNSSSTWQSISIKDSSYGDPLTNVSIYNDNSGQWESILASQFTGGTSPSEHVNTTLVGNAGDYGDGSGQIMLRYNWSGSITNNALGLDLINVTVIYFSGGVYRLNITSNTTGIPNATTQVLQIGYNVSGDNFTVQIWDGSAWNNRTILNKTTADSHNITLLPQELLQDGSTSGGSLGDISKYYVLVRYKDLNASGTPGRLYLDYQRVYSS